MCIYTTSIPLKQVYYSSTIAGGGKTYAATKYAFRLALEGEKVVTAFPTRQLCRPAYRDLLSGDRHPNATSLVTKITTDDTKRVVVEITNFLQNVGDGGKILFITHAAFEKVRDWWRPEVWHVIIDEVMPLSFTEKLPLSTFKYVLDDLLTHQELGEWVRVASAKSKQDFMAQIARNKDKDKIAAVIQPLAEKLTNHKWQRYIDREQWHRWRDGEAKEIELHAIYDVAEFARFKSVTIRESARQYNVQSSENVLRHGATRLDRSEPQAQHAYQ
jgi:hypothetical protein